MACFIEIIHLPPASLCLYLSGLLHGDHSSTASFLRPILSGLLHGDNSFIHLPHPLLLLLCKIVSFYPDQSLFDCYFGQTGGGGGGGGVNNKERNVSQLLLIKLKIMAHLFPIHKRPSLARLILSLFSKTSRIIILYNWDDSP